jgi:CheY-like chemotaxis protein
VIWLEADPTRLEQILWNLLNNSAKYTPNGGEISLVVEAVEGEVVLRVRDTGIGIKPEMLPRIFDMFVQVKDHEGHSQDGLGIGLCLVRTLVEMHEGSITAHSDGPGHGSEFAVRLPRPARSSVVTVPATDRHHEPGGKPPRCRVLVVDDNVDAATSLGTLLRLHGQEVRVANDGAEALSVAREFRPQVILLDIGMPRMDGNEVVRRLREFPEFEKILIVALTGWGRESDEARTRAAGFDHHLVKPADPGAILDLLTKTGIAVT